MELRDSEKLQAGYRVVRVAALALAASVLAYGAVVEALLGAMAFGGSGMGDTFRPLLVGLMLGCAGAAVWWREHRLRAVDPAAVVEQVLVPGERVRRMVASSLVALALSEAAAVLGLIGFLLSGERLDFYVGALVALSALALNFPSWARWNDWFAAVRRVR